MNIIIENNKDLRDLTTFKVPVKSRYFAEYSSERELLAISRSPEFLNNRVLHIGGGSNLLFLSDYDGLILHSKVKGIKEYKKDDRTVYAIVGAAENWDGFVRWCIDRGLAGVENLALIPGEVGASAVQNIGAYGVEAGDVIHSVECFDILSRKTVTFSKEECRFGYRDSMFKHEGKGRYYVLRVCFKLSPSTEASSFTYGPLKDLKEQLGHTPSIREVADTVVSIRKSKLPDPETIGSAGSFFKNPVVSKDVYDRLCREYHDIPGYNLADGTVKLSAAWLIDRCGLKGYRKGDAEVYSLQPLVIVNTGNATGEDVREVADHVIKTVRSKFYITLHPEVNIIDTDIKITVLGSGTSKGVPEIGCKCYVCQSSDSHDKRLRSSVMVETEGVRILIDVSPDFREQMLRFDPADIDAVLITHTHFDHVGGIDDLRPFCGGDGLDIYLKEDVNRDLHKRLDYCFRPVLYPGVPHFNMHEIGDSTFDVKGIKVTPIHVNHGKLPILGYRIGSFAYITDAKTLAENECEKLENLEVLILNSLRDKDHFAHLTIDEALQLIRELQPKRAYLTHFSHEAGKHADLAMRLPENVFPCYDGEVIEIKGYMPAQELN